MIRFSRIEKARLDNFGLCRFIVSMFEVADNRSHLDLATGSTIHIEPWLWSCD
jgi:hypothetical protein